MLITTDEQLICGCRVFYCLITIKTPTIKNLEGLDKIRFFFVKFQAPFPQKNINIHLYISYNAFIRSIV